MVTWVDYLLAALSLALAVAAGVWRARARSAKWSACATCGRWPAVCFTYWAREDGRRMEPLHRCRGCVLDGTFPPSGGKR